MLSVPLGHVTSSSLTNPATASVKTIVGVDVSPVSGPYRS